MAHVQRLVNELLDESRALWVPKSIAEYGADENERDAVRFVREHVGQSIPCVWRGAAAHWPAVSQWRRDDGDYGRLRSLVGSNWVDVAWTPDGRADAVVSLREDGDEANGGPNGSSVDKVFAMPFQKRMRFDALLDSLVHDDVASLSSSPIPSRSPSTLQQTGIPYYSSQNSNVTRELAGVMEDIDTSTIEFARCAFGDDAATAVNMWVGDGRSETTMHADPFENVYVVVQGRKTFTVRPPCDAAVLPKRALKRAKWIPWCRREQRRRVSNDVDEHVDTGKETTEELKTRVEYDGWRLDRVEGETSWIDEDAICGDMGQGVSVDVCAGDVFYLPALWFHRVTQHGVTIAVNWWFDMVFGKDWVYRELCFGVGRLLTRAKLTTGRDGDNDEDDDDDDDGLVTGDEASDDEDGGRGGRGGGENGEVGDEEHVHRLQ